MIALRRRRRSHSSEVRAGLISPAEWRRVVDTSLPAGDDVMDPGHEVLIDPADHYIASPRSTVILAAL